MSFVETNGINRYTWWDSDTRNFLLQDERRLVQ